MKIVDYNEVVRLPAGTGFCPYEPCFFHSPLQIKTDTGREYNGQHIFNGAMPLEPWFIDQDNLPTETGTYNTVMAIWDDSSVDFEKDGLFAVLEKHEIEELINVLKWALNGCKGG